MRMGQGVFLDFGANESLRNIVAEYDEQLDYVATQAKNQLGLSAVLVRPDGVVAWAADSALNTFNTPDINETLKAIESNFSRKQNIPR